MKKINVVNSLIYLIDKTAVLFGKIDIVERFLMKEPVVKKYNLINLKEAVVKNSTYMSSLKKVTLKKYHSEILVFQLNLKRKEQEHPLQLDINVLKRKIRLKQDTGLVI